MSEPSELELLQQALSHLWPHIEGLSTTGLGLSGIAWLHLPGDEAAAVERATGRWPGGKCTHGRYLSRCDTKVCRAQIQVIFDGWNAQAELDRMNENDLAAGA